MFTIGRTAGSFGLLFTVKHITLINFKGSTTAISEISLLRFESLSWGYNSQTWNGRHKLSAIIGENVCNKTSVRITRKLYSRELIMTVSVEVTARERRVHATEASSLVSSQWVSLWGKVSSSVHSSFHDMVGVLDHFHAGKSSTAASTILRVWTLTVLTEIPPVAADTINRSAMGVVIWIPQCIRRRLQRKTLTRAD